jgi:geranylgeranyl diphosphate synthase type II
MAKSKLSPKIKLNKENFESLLQERVNNEISKYVINTNEIDESMRYALSNPGKRVRPLLSYLVGDVFNLNLNKLDSTASAIEIIHTYSLVHDDLPCMDDDDLRRGRPTLHVKYSESTAVLAGDAMASLAIDIILHDLNLSSDLKVQLLQFLMKTIGPEGMILGQIQDITFENISVTEEEILKMNELKTGALVEFSMLAPVIIAGEDIKQWGKIAKKVGITFQLIDDLLDIQETEEKVGKATKKDKKKNKKNYPICFGVNKTRDKIKEYQNEVEILLSEMNLSDHPISIYINKLFARQK